MGVLKRVSDIVTANVNEMVERFESPETMLRLAIREMQAAASGTMEATARVIADERLIENQIARHREESKTLFERASEAVSQHQDDRARRLLFRRHEHEELIGDLEDQLAVARSTAGRLRRQLDAVRTRIGQAERKLQLLVARQRALESQRRMLPQRGALGVGDAGFARFDRMCRKIERAEADALVELACADDADEREATPSDEIETQLQALKQQPR